MSCRSMSARRRSADNGSHSCAEGCYSGYAPGPSVFVFPPMEECGETDRRSISVVSMTQEVHYAFNELELTIAEEAQGPFDLVRPGDKSWIRCPRSIRRQRQLPGGLGDEGQETNGRHSFSTIAVWVGHLTHPRAAIRGARSDSIEAYFQKRGFWKQADRSAVLGFRREFTARLRAEHERARVRSLGGVDLRRPHRNG